MKGGWGVAPPPTGKGFRIETISVPSYDNFVILVGMVIGNIYTWVIANNYRQVAIFFSTARTRKLWNIKTTLQQ